jgi:alcohol dehydrogenase
MISKAWFQTMVEYHACDEQLIKLAKALGKEDADDARDFIDALQELQETCHVADLKMSDYGIANEEIPEMVKSAREMGGLFRADPIILSDEDLIKIYEISYR